MEKQLADLIKKNRGILRQLTDLNNRVRKLEEAKEEKVMYSMKKFKPIIREQMSEEEITNIKVGGTD